MAPPSLKWRRLQCRQPRPVDCITGKSPPRSVLGPAEFDCHVLALDIAGVFEALAKPAQTLRAARSRHQAHPVLPSDHCVRSGRAARATRAQSEPECLCGALGQVGEGGVPIQGDPLWRALPAAHPSDDRQPDLRRLRFRLTPQWCRNPMVCISWLRTDGGHTAAAAIASDENEYLVHECASSSSTGESEQH